MTMQEIQRQVRTEPFEPFRILTADGRRFDVRHPESIALHGKGRLIVVALADHFVTLDLLLVTGIKSPIPKRKARKSA